MATTFKMEQDLYVDTRLRPLVREVADRHKTHRIIYEELSKRIQNEERRSTYINAAARLVQAGE